MQTISKNSGFTLIETIVVLSMLSIILVSAMTLDFNSLQTSNFENEKSKIISLLTKARSRAMANLNDTTHGLCYVEPDYIIFQNTCDPEDAQNEKIPAEISIASHASTLFPSITFDRLTGKTTETTIYITDGIKSAEIKINDAGTISW